MRLKNDPSGIDDLVDFLRNYYEGRGREIRYLSSGTVGRGGDEGDYYYVSCLLDRKHVIKYSIPTAIRTFAGLWVGIGPEYVPIEWVVNQVSAKRFNGDSTSEAVEQNLALLDEYLAGGLA